MFGSFEKRAITPNQVWGSGGDLATSSEAGVYINGDTAFTISAFFSAVSLVSDTISTLPVGAYIRQGSERLPLSTRPVWLDQPDVNTTRQAHYGAVVSSLLVYGNSYTRVFRDRQGEIVNLVVLDPTTVTVKMVNGKKVFDIQGEKKLLTTDDVLHIIDFAVPGGLIGLSRVEKLKETLGIASALQKFAAEFFANGLQSDTIIIAPPTTTSAQAKDLVDGFNSRHRGWKRSHRAGILTGGADIKNLGTDPEKAQVLESRRFAVEEIARAFNIPLHQMGVPGTNTYASVEQSNLQWLSHGIRPILEKIEWSYSLLLPVPRAFVKFNFNALLRGDLQSRATAYSILTQAGIMSVNDARALEDLSPVTGGDVNRVPLANIDLSGATLVGEEMKVKMAQYLVQVGFDPADVLAKIGLPQIAHSGLPSVQLQPVQNIDPNAPENVYGVN